MENASKALIIAGAILLAIILISLGIMVTNNAKKTIGDSNLDAETAQAFNTKITQYCGNSKSAADMNALMEAIAASNGAQKKLAAEKQHYIVVTVNGNTSGGFHTGTSLNEAKVKAASVTYPTFSAGTTFTATYTMGDTGYVNKVTVTIK